MSQSETEQIVFCLKRDEHLKQWFEALQQIADERGVEPDDLSRPDVFEALAEEYLNDEETEAYRQFQRLKDDQRIQEARAVVAKDHGLTADEVSLISLLKVTCSAYCGYTQTSDWRPSNAETAGFKEEVKTDGGKQ